MIDARGLVETAKSVHGVRVGGLCLRGYCDYVLYYKFLDNEAYFRVPFLAAMRGTVVRVYDSGEVRLLAFPFAKFFNYGEVDATKSLPRVGFTVTEKLDGTLMIVWRDPDTGDIRATTRGMIDRNKKGRIVNPFTERFFAAVERDNMTDELERLVRDDRTLMFELVWRVPASKQFNVFKTPVHDKDWQVYLLAYRDLKTLEVEYSIDTQFKRPAFYDVSSVDEVLEIVDRMSDSEGVVVHYRGLSYDERYSWWSLMVKLKSKAYLAKIYAGSDKRRWQSLARLVVRGLDDDVYAALDESEREFVSEFKRLYREFYDAAVKLVETVSSARAVHGSAVDRFVKHSIRASYILNALDESRGDTDKAVQLLAEQLLLSAKKREPLLRAAAQMRDRLVKVADTVRKQFLRS